MKRITRKLSKLLLKSGGSSSRRRSNCSTPGTVSREPSIDVIPEDREPSSIQSCGESSAIPAAPPRPPLIPGLPDDLALQCLVRCPRHMFPTMGRVSKVWSEVITSEIFAELRKDLGLLEPFLHVVEQRPRDGVCFIYSLDLSASRWKSVPCRVGNTLIDIPAGSECVVIGHRMIFLGGGTQWQSSNNVWCFDSALGRWFRLAPMLTARSSFACGVAGDQVFAVGGYGANGVALACAEVYDPETNAWQVISDMKVARGGCLGVEQRGRFYVIGDTLVGDGGKVCREAEVYNPDMDTWLTLQTKTWDLTLPPCPAFIDIDGPIRPKTAVLQGHLYAIDESGFPRLLHYDQRMNIWNIVCLLPNHSGDGANRFAMAAYGEELFIVGRKRVYSDSPEKSVEVCLPLSDDVRSSWRVPRQYAYGNFLNEIRACAVIEL
ncbi:hypothetical protein CBR_g38018 [Chara braunii]|uniref:F-box domain-containing protein n=1 Tax=Chara braunii TaxID=69332 RepID=A0A388K049_CHABU|nr:hypothetical protein CBR_g38018 [Chara braunii]|eukprot:GBG63395.1 hypothetical protein CBR_g38018 [Chara braunii]